MRLSAVTGCLSALLVLAVGANARAATLCVPGPNTSGLSVSDVTLGGSNATNCYGIVSGNNSNQDVNSVGGGAMLFGGSNWGTELKDDNPGASPDGAMSYYGVNWTVSANAGTSNSWTLSFTDGSPSVVPFTTDLLVVLKGGSYYAAYFFDDFLFDGTSKAGDFTMYSAPAGNSGNLHQPALSHLSLYFRDAAAVDPCGPTDRCHPTVPEPVSLVLLGSGFLGLGMVMARRRRQK